MEYQPVGLRACSCIWIAFLCWELELWAIDAWRSGALVKMGG
jgi:hypothetical protein